MAKKVEITSQGIKRALNKYSYEKALAEYIWNGFDAKATSVLIEYESIGTGAIQEIRIRDNGHGIPRSKLDEKFLPLFESHKAINPDTTRVSSETHGKNGYGRLTFFQFASDATWTTVYETIGNNGRERRKYEIRIHTNTLNSYEASDETITDDPIGTTVTFHNIYSFTIFELNQKIIPFLMREFCWLLELNRPKGYSIQVNGDLLNHMDVVGDYTNFDLAHQGHVFDVTYVRWVKGLNREYSRYYYVNSQHKELAKETTTLNNKSDSFYHSVYVRSDFFDGMIDLPKDVDVHKQAEIFVELAQQNDVFSWLKENLEGFLRDKRKPFLRDSAQNLIIEFQNEDIFPDFGSDVWDKMRQEYLEQVVREIYLAEPKVFSNLNTEQKKTIVRLLNLILESSERDKLLDILGEIVHLNPNERAELSQLLKRSRLQNVISTIKLIEDRVIAVNQLRDLVYRPEMGANEPKHVQKFIEAHYWLFGEQYNLVTAAEPKFEQALRGFQYILRGETGKPVIDHPDKYKEMDIFMVQIMKESDRIRCIVVELKHPNVALGEKELSQVKKYLRVIQSESEFNGSNIFWEFYLVGNKFDTSGYIDGEIESQKTHGERSLVHKAQNHKVYVKTWSEIFTEFELQHGFLLDKLKIEREQLVVSETTADEVIQNLGNSSAIMPPQVAIPDK